MTGATGSVMIMAGGTGGHIFPGLAVAEELQARGVGVRWLGAEGGMECRRVPSQGIGLDAIRIAGVRGRGLAGWLALPFRLGRAVRDAGRSMNERRPDCAVSFGGYAAGPGGIAARLRGIPLIVHEQNRVPGLTNRVLATIAAEVFQAFPDTFPARVGAVTSGNPVRLSVTSLEPPDDRFRGRAGRPHLLVTGGSQGAASLNRVVPAALARLAPGRRPEVLHQAGRSDKDTVAAAYDQAGIGAEVVEFIDDMAAAYGKADLVLCRAGALTISELAAAGLGAVLVPFPHAVDDHQTRNAEVLADTGGAVVLQEHGLDADSLAAALAPLLGSRDTLSAMASAAYTVGVRDAARRLATACAGHLPPAAGEVAA